MLLLLQVVRRTQSADPPLEICALRLRAIAPLHRNTDARVRYFHDTSLPGRSLPQFGGMCGVTEDNMPVDGIRQGRQNTKKDRPSFPGRPFVYVKHKT
jgi:hypothetical protein